MIATVVLISPRAVVIYMIGSDDGELAIVAAVADNGVIGDDGVPWDEPADLERFRVLTLGCPVVVGRRTWETMPTDLPGRTSIVMSRGGKVGDADLTAGTVNEALHLAAERSNGMAFVAGGANVYEQMMPHADRMFITRVPGEPDGDAVFPGWDESRWRRVSTECRNGLAFCEYGRLGHSRA